MRWRGDFAESAELRRAYSGLYGRFFARALLMQHLKFNRFVSLQRDGIELPAASVRVQRSSKGDIPDWLAWDDAGSRFVLCEAKGSLTARDFLHSNVPKCVQVGKRQFDRVQTSINGRVIRPAQWVAAARWATDDRDGEPITALWDPPSGGQPFDEDDARRFRGAITYAWLDSIAPGLGYRSGDELISSDREGQALMVKTIPGPVPEGEDWPTTERYEGLLSGLPLEPGSYWVRVQDNTISNAQILTILSDTLRNSAVYSGPHSPLVPTEPEMVAHTGKYISVLVTRFGIRPVRGKADLPEALEIQKRARDGEEPAMLIGIPVGIDPFQSRGGTTWESGAGLAVDGDLALFDLRRINLQSVD